MNEIDWPALEAYWAEQYEQDYVKEICNEIL